MKQSIKRPYTVKSYFGIKVILKEGMSIGINSFNYFHLVTKIAENLNKHFVAGAEGQGFLEEITACKTSDVRLYMRYIDACRDGKKYSEITGISPYFISVEEMSLFLDFINADRCYTPELTEEKINNIRYKYFEAKGLARLACIDRVTGELTSGKRYTRALDGDIFNYLVKIGVVFDSDVKPDGNFPKHIVVNPEIAKKEKSNDF